MTRQFACAAADLKDTAAFRRKESFDEVISVTRLEVHSGVLQLVACASRLKIYLSLSKVHFSRNCTRHPNSLSPAALGSSVRIARWRYRKNLRVRTSR